MALTQYFRWKLLYFDETCPVNLFQHSSGQVRSSVVSRIFS